MAEDNDSKTEEPTAQKLAKAKEKGDVPRSQDIGQMASLAATGMVLLIGGGWIGRTLTGAMRPFIERPDAFSMDGGALAVMSWQVVGAVGPVILAVMLVAALAGFGSGVAQGGMRFNTEKLKPDLAKLNPLSAFKRIYGPDGLMQFLKTLVKVIVTSIVVWMVLKPHTAEVPNLSALSVAAILPYAVKLVTALFIAVLVLLGVTAGFDWFWQRYRFLTRMRMSKEEIKEEFKQTDGDPHVKARQRQIRMQQSRRRMMQNVPKATVVVMNPTHYAVALRYEKDETPAPVCVAKGVDELALKIRDVAKAAGVTVVEDPPLARALYAAVDVDDEIPAVHFEAVAKIISFVLSKSADRRRRARPL